MISSSIINITPRLLLLLVLVQVLLLSRRIFGFSINGRITTTSTAIKQPQLLLLEQQRVQQNQRQYNKLLLSYSKLQATVINDPTSVLVQNDDKDSNEKKKNDVIVPYITEPLAPHTFAGMVEQRMIEKFGSTNIERIIQSWRLLESGYIHDEYLHTNDTTKQDMMRQYCQSYVPGLTIQSFWDIQNFNWSNKLKSNYQLIKNEFVRVTSDMTTLQQRGNNIWAGALTNDAGSYGVGWKTLVLMDRGIWDPVNVNLFPITAKVIHDAKIPAVEVFFASMEPNSSIKIHSDFTNFVLTCHLGLIIPESGNNKCRLTVGDTTHQWINGNVMIFDTSLMHDAINDSNETRYILMLRIWHPDLTPVERDVIQFTYNCLDVPGLVSTDVTEREQAEQYIQQRMKFPLISSTSIASKTGFGNTKSTSDKKKGKSSKKKK